MAKKEAVKNEVENTKEQKQITADDVLQRCVGKGYSNVIVLGVFPDGFIDLDTISPYYATMNHLLGRAQFKLLAVEDAQIAERYKAAQEAKAIEAETKGE